MKRGSTVLALGMIGALLGMPAAHAANELVIALSIPKTGPYVSLSNTNEIAAMMAVEEINAKGGVNGKKIKTVGFDTGGNPKEAVVAVRRFAKDDKALAIVGPLASHECQVAFPAGEQEGIVQMSMASSAPGLTRGFTYAFRNTVNEGQVIGNVMETLVRKKLPHQTGSIAHATDDAVSKAIGTGVMPAIFKKFKVTHKDTVDFQAKAFDLSPQATQLVRNQPDLIGLGAPPDTVMKLATELRRQGWKGRMFSGTTIADPDLPRRMGAAGDNLTIGTTFFKDLNAKTKAFTAEFEKRAKAAGLSRTEPNQFDAATYDIVLLYADAMAKTRATGDPAKVAQERKAIRDYLAGLKKFQGLEGDITFNSDRDASKPVYVIEARNGAWNLLDTHAPK